MSDDQPNSPFPGELYLLTTTNDTDIEWLVTHEHPDDRETVFVVPCDSFTLAGSKDIEIPYSLVRRPLCIRTEQGVWVPAELVRGSTKCGTLSAEAVKLVRQFYTALVRGGVTFGGRDDADPYYIEWKFEVSKAGLELRNKRYEFEHRRA
jgi:hypothetical protein